MTLSRILLASISALALSSAPAYADEPPAAPAAQAAPAAPAQAAPAAPAQATGRDVDLAGDGLDAEAMKKLTGDQIVEVMRQRARATQPRPEELIPIVVPVTSFLFLFFGVYAGLYYGARKDRERNETLRTLIQRGGTIPPELLVPPVKKQSDLRRGITLVAGGLGASIFVAATPAGNGIWTVGLIPMLIGAGYLVTWKLLRSEPLPIRDEAAIAAEREVNNL